MKFLKAPWRWNFISNIGKEKGCLFCRAVQSGADAPGSLICHRGKKYFVILNKFPYSTGHLMVVPYEHLDSPEKIPPSDTVEMWDLLNKSLRILSDNFKPTGFNVGMNLGKSAGAGVRDHFHLHVVPRWPGDANFMATVGETKVLSYKIEDVLETLKQEFKNG